MMPFLAILIFIEMVVSGTLIFHSSQESLGVLCCCIMPIKTLVWSIKQGIENWQGIHSSPRITRSTVLLYYAYKNTTGHWKLTGHFCFLLNLSNFIRLTKLMLCSFALLCSCSACASQFASYISRFLIGFSSWLVVCIVCLCYFPPTHALVTSTPYVLFLAKSC